MSAQGDYNLVQSVREQLADAITNEKTLLVSATSERKAGYIQGLMDALEVVNSTYLKMTGTDRKQ